MHKERTPLTKAEEIALIQKLATRYGDEPTYFCDAFGHHECAGSDAAIMIENIKNDLDILLGTEVTKKAAELQTELAETKRQLERTQQALAETLHEAAQFRQSLQELQLNRHQIIRELLQQHPEHIVVEKNVSVKERAEIKIDNNLPLSMDEANYLLSLIDRDQRSESEISDDLAKLTE